jgi:DNA repair protein RadC
MRLRELRISYHAVTGAPAGPRSRLTTPAETAGLLAPLLEAEAVEVFGVLLLNTKHEPVAWHVLSRGCLDATLVHPRDVIKAACLGNAAAVIVAHNHPSGDPEPSADDILLSQRLRDVLCLVGIDFLDSIVIGEAGRYASLRSLGTI